MHFDIDPHTIFLCLSGSHAYGMSRADSDVDIRGVCVPPRRLRESHYLSFDQHTVAAQQGTWGDCSAQALERLLDHPTAGECYRRSDPFARANGTVDLCIYSIHKFVRMCAANNPSFLEILFVPDDAVLFQTPDWERLREHREIFLSKEVRHRYVGYAMGQLKRIKGHREWLLNPPKAAPTRGEFDLPEESVIPADVRNLIDEAVLKVLRGWGVEDGLDDYLDGAVQDTLRERMVEFQTTVLRCSEEALDEKVYALAGASLGLTRDVLFAIKQERRYRAARKHWTQFLKWKEERNPARAELEAKFGFDSKHASHLIRLLRTGLELMTEGKLRVWRGDAEELMAIRDGAMTYDELMEASRRLEDAIRAAVPTCPLPNQPDREKIDDLLLSILDRRYSIESDYSGLEMAIKRQVTPDPASR
jgi:hypothetical protein